MDLHPRRVLPVLAALLVLPETAAACPICFGAVESPLLDSARLGVLAMAALTVGVLASFGAWFVKLARLEAQQSTGEDPPGEASRSADPQSAMGDRR